MAALRRAVVDAGPPIAGLGAVILWRPDLGVRRAGGGKAPRDVPNVPAARPR